MTKTANTIENQDESLDHLLTRRIAELNNISIEEVTPKFISDKLEELEEHTSYDRSSALGGYISSGLKISTRAEIKAKGDDLQDWLRSKVG